MTVTEYSPMCEACTATIHLEGPLGEAVQGPISVGYYPEQNEFWLEQEGRRVQFHGMHLQDVLKQLRRAKKIHDELIPEGAPNV